MGLPQRTWQRNCLRPCRCAANGSPFASPAACTSIRVLKRTRVPVHIPPQSINETAIQINVFSSGVAIMVKALEQRQLHYATSRHLNWLDVILVSLFFRLFGTSQHLCVGCAPTMSHPWFLSGAPRNSPSGRREREIAPDHPAKHAKLPPSAGAPSKPVALCPHWTAVRNRFRTLALKVQWTRIATSAVTAFDPVTGTRTNLKMQ